MSEAMARAVGAGSPLTVEIDGKQCVIRPLTIRELTEVERDCVEIYRRSYLKTFADNIDLLPEAIRKPMMQEKFEEAARWDVGDLPHKEAYDVSTVVISKNLRKFMAEKFGPDAVKDDDAYKRFVVTALDQKTITVKQYEEFTGNTIKSVKIPYVAWWITGSMEGMVSFVWMTLRHSDVTREQVLEAFSDKPNLMAEVAQEIERVSAPQVKNG